MKFKTPFQLSYSLCVEVSNDQLWICVDFQTFLILLGLLVFSSCQIQREHVAVLVYPPFFKMRQSKH